ncbi:mannose-1-phosphate guanylyltransferase [candidate division KSB1 bacterium]|nr:mannose-1-phosphate guanylyltransferase [candidate division KSB1 bacterium]
MSSPFNNAYAIIMAGGIGSRFWPKSRASQPKQYLSLVDDGSLIQNTVKRLHDLFSDDAIFVVSTQNQQQLLHEQLPELRPDQIFFEPVGRNTAPAIGLAAIQLLDRNPDAVMTVLPADHHIQNDDIFLDTLRTAIRIAHENQTALVTLGINPSYPATGYGYIEAGQRIKNDTFRVTRFMEKPDRATAEEFINKGNYYWNSGIFIWRAATILGQIQRYMPDLYDGLLEIKTAMHSKNFQPVCQRVYTLLPGQSIDFGVMEKAKNVYMVRADFGWSDLGTWEEVYKTSAKDENGNVVKGQPLLKSVINSYIEIGDRTVSIIGLDDIIVVDQPDALLICKKELSQDVRWVTKELQDTEDKNDT